MEASLYVPVDMQEDLETLADKILAESGCMLDGREIEGDNVSLRQFLFENTVSQIPLDPKSERLHGARYLLAH